MNQAVIETGGKQYLVSANDTLEIEKLDGKSGDEITFDKVLLLVDGDKVSVGKPYLNGAKVKGKILDQTKADKIVIFKYRAKSRYRRKTGHRQKLTEVKIQSIA